MPVCVITTKTRSLYELPPEGDFVLNEGCDSAQGLVAWWPLTGGKGRYLDHARKRKFPLTLTGTNGRRPTWDCGHGFSNTGSTSNFLSTIATPPVTTYPLTGCFWVWPRTTGEYGAEMAGMHVGNSAGSNYLSVIYDGSNGEGTGAHKAVIDMSGGGSNVQGSTGSLAAAGTPAMITFVGNSTSARTIYLNGAGTQNTTAGLTTPSGWDRYTIGAYRDSTTFNPLNAVMWWPAWWNVAKSDAQVERMYDPKTRYELAYSLGKVAYSFSAPAGGVSVTPTTAALALATFAPTVLTPRLVTPGVKSLTLSAFAPSVVVNTRVTPGVKALALSTFAPAVATPRLVTPGVKALTLSTFAPTVAAPRLVTPGVRALTLSTFAPTVATPRLVTPGKLSLTLAAFAPTVAAPRLATPGVKALSLSTFAPTVATPRIVVPGTKVLTLTTFAPSVTLPGVVTPSQASLVLTKYAPTVATPRVVTPGKVALTLSAFAPTVATPRMVSPAAIALILSPFPPTVTASSGVVLPAASDVLYGVYFDETHLPAAGQVRSGVTYG